MIYFSILTLLPYMCTCHTAQRQAAAVGLVNTLAVDQQSSRSRLNSHHVRELTYGKFLIKYENLSQFENIGQGIHSM